MATLSVRNVGPIREADIEIRKHTVFIGPQGSGKSTLAKLIAILSARKSEKFSREILDDYGIGEYVTKDSIVFFDKKQFKSSLENLEIYYSALDTNGKVMSQIVMLADEESKPSDWPNEKFDVEEFFEKLKLAAIKDGADSSNIVQKIMSQFAQGTDLWYPFSAMEYYIPTERNVFPMLSDAVWSFLNNDVNLPQFIKHFGDFFEQARNTQSQLYIPFLNIRYSRENGRDLVYYDTDRAVPLAQSASGYQAIIPLLLVVEHQRRQAKRRFIIEEPELNLYPTTQKELIYALISGLDPSINHRDSDLGPTVTYYDAEWVFTTHSPYILSSLNTLLLAWKVAHQSDELRAKVEQIIPARSWINPDEFAAYYVDNGTVESITSPETGLINDSRLDDVSDALADEQDQLRALRRSLSRA